MVSASGPSKTVDIQRILDGGQLPALPQSAIRILELSKDPNIGPNEFAVPIEADPGLTGQVLKFVNSSYFGFSREIPTVKNAITLVGVRTIKNFTLWSAVFSLMPNPKCGVFDLKKLCQDSLRRGLFARLASRWLGARDPEEAFASALLQDMAVPLLIKEFPAEYGELLALRAGGQTRLSMLELERFGFTHGEVASAMARRWHLPEELAEPIEKHGDIEALFKSEKTIPQVMAVALSALLPASIDGTWAELPVFEEYYQRVKPADAPEIPQLCEQLDRDFQDFAPALKMPAASQKLTDLYAQATGTAAE